MCRLMDEKENSVSDVLNSKMCGGILWSLSPEAPASSARTWSMLWLEQGKKVRVIDNFSSGREEFLSHHLDGGSVEIFNEDF